MIPSASKTALFLTCGFPWERPDVPKVHANEPMLYGSASHELLAESIDRQRKLFSTPEDIAKRWGIPDAPTLAAHTAEAVKELQRWLGGDNAFKVDFTPAMRLPTAHHIEKSVAYNPTTNKARAIANPTQPDHIYAERKPGELPGTVDLALRLSLVRKMPARFRKAVLILDYKTGAECDPPGRSAQLASLSLAYARLWGADRAIVAILHAPREGVPTVYSDELSPDDLKRHRAKLSLAFGRIGDGTLRPGEHCGWCQALSICPVYGAGLASLAKVKTNGAAKADANGTVALAMPTQKIDLATPEGIGRAHALIKTYDDMRNAIWEEMKARIAIQGPGIREDGLLVTLVTTERDNLSKTSIVEALGPIEGARMIKTLQDKKCIKKSKRVEMRAVPDR